MSIKAEHVARVYAQNIDLRWMQLGVEQEQAVRAKLCIAFCDGYLEALAFVKRIQREQYENEKRTLDRLPALMATDITEPGGKNSRS